MRKRKATGERDCYFRPCRAKYKKAHYAANKHCYIRNANAWKPKLFAKRVSWLLTYFETHPCVDCGETDPVVLDFDHVRDKDFAIGEGIRYKGWDAVLAEIEKCEVRCANCHRRRTAERGRFARVMFVNWRAVAADRVI